MYNKSIGGTPNNDPTYFCSWAEDPTVLSVTTTTDRTSELNAGKYVIDTDFDCRIKQGGSSVDATTSSRRLFAGQPMGIEVNSTNGLYIAAITEAGTASLNITKVE